jgi:integrase
MKNHKAFETSLPRDLVESLKAYVEVGFRALTGRDPEEDDELLRNRKGRPFEVHAFRDRVKAMTHRWLGKRIHPHLFRHMLATHGAQTLHMSPKQLAAMLSHKSIRTVMKYYEVTSPLQAAEAFDGG